MPRYAYCTRRDDKGHRPVGFVLAPDLQCARTKAQSRYERGLARLLGVRTRREVRRLFRRKSPMTVYVWPAPPEEVTP